ncbi:MAG: amino acid ABC transporter permease, partial [Oscillatoriales cyanobacterium RM1_1_9]|nr:amino acid ABC transporter permease [Oscillatoriales cyanobacterium RM1_1_9]
MKKISVVYVEIVRNTPLLLQLLFWYGLFLQLPALDQRLNLLNLAFLSKRGIYVPWPMSNLIWIWLGILLVEAIAAFLIWRWQLQVIVEQGQSGQLQQRLMLGLGLAALLIILFGFGWSFPQSTESGVD